MRVPRVHSGISSGGAEWATGPFLHSLHGRPSAEHRPDRVLLDVRVEVPIAAALLLRLAADHVVNDPLVHSLAGQGSGVMAWPSPLQFSLRNSVPPTTFSRPGWSYPE